MLLYGQRFTNARNCAEQTELVKQRLQSENQPFDWTVVTSYDLWATQHIWCFWAARKNPQDHVILLPLFPAVLRNINSTPLWCFCKMDSKTTPFTRSNINQDYYQHPMFIQALADSVVAYQAQYGKPEKLLMSFHGIPQPYADKGDPYADRCRMTAKLVAEALDLNEHEWAISFQSRFGKQESVKPYTDVILQQWGEQKVKSVQVLQSYIFSGLFKNIGRVGHPEWWTVSDIRVVGIRSVPALNSHRWHLICLLRLVQANLDALNSYLSPSLNWTFYFARGFYAASQNCTRYCICPKLF